MATHWSRSQQKAYQSAQDKVRDARKTGYDPVVESEWRALRRDRKNALKRAKRAADRAAKKNAAALNGAKATAKKIAGTPAPTLAAPATKLVKNHFVLVLDHSCSMSSHREGATKLYNETLAQLSKDEAAGGAQNRVTVFEFGLRADVWSRGNAAIREVCYNLRPGELPQLSSSDWKTESQTPLIDAVMDATGRALADGDPDVSFAVLVLTDGMENDSKRHTKELLQKRLEELQATDRWTIAFMVPPGMAKYALELGVPAGNVKEWSSAARLAEETYSSTNSYLQERKTSGGLMRSSKKYFQPDASHVSASSLKNVTATCDLYRVEQEEDIRSFLDRKTKGAFAVGDGYYQLVKREAELQEYKKLLLLNKGTGEVYGDYAPHDVRRALGLPGGGTIPIEPGNHGDFDVFVQSTSTNRVLPRGSMVIYHPST